MRKPLDDSCFCVGLVLEVREPNRSNYSFPYDMQVRVLADDGELRIIDHLWIISTAEDWDNI